MKSILIEAQQKGMSTTKDVAIRDITHGLYKIIQSDDRDSFVYNYLTIRTMDDSNPYFRRIEVITSPYYTGKENELPENFNEEFEKLYQEIVSYVLYSKFMEKGIYVTRID